MASRKEQKEQARQRRLAEERATAERARRTRRMQLLGGVVLLAMIVVGAAIALSSGGSSVAAVKPQSAAAKAASARVNQLLVGIPQSGTTLGTPHARVTITEYGDLECSVCDAFALAPSVTDAEGDAGSGYENDVINDFVRTGKADLVFKSLETASSGNPDPNAFALQQAAAYAAGRQDKAWYYIELFYNEQGREDTGYVTESYLQGLARQISGLKFNTWMSDRNLSSIQNQVTADNAAGSAIDAGEASTPTIVISGPRGEAKPIVGLPSSWGELESTIKSVS
jgi:protein-disulfide isomerase